MGHAKYRPGDRSRAADVERLVKQARSGNQRAAWLLVREIEASLASGSLPAQLCAYTAPFFRALLDRKSATATADARELAPALERLHLVSKGHPATPPFDWIEPAAKVELLRACGISAAQAYRLLAALGGGMFMKTYRAAREEWRASFEFQRHTIEQLEELAHITLTDLLAELVRRKEITLTTSKSLRKQADKVRGEQRQRRARELRDFRRKHPTIVDDAASSSSADPTADPYPPDARSESDLRGLQRAIRLRERSKQKST